jgi:hypothetical protein
MFALYYTDNQQFIAAPERWVHAVALAEMLAARTAREIAVVYNGADGTTEIYCRCEGNGIKFDRKKGAAVTPAHLSGQGSGITQH